MAEETQEERFKRRLIQYRSWLLTALDAGTEEAEISNRDRWSQIDYLRRAVNHCYEGLSLIDSGVAAAAWDGNDRRKKLLEERDRLVREEPDCGDRRDSDRLDYIRERLEQIAREF